MYWVRELCTCELEVVIPTPFPVCGWQEGGSGRPEFSCPLSPAESAEHPMGLSLGLSRGC